MSKKQTIGLITAGLVFSFVCFMSVLSTNMAKKAHKKNYILEAVNNQLNNFNLPMENFIGVVTVSGTIMDQSTSFSSEAYNHQNTLSLIDALMDSKSNKGLLLKVNSPGGTIYASDELYLKLKQYKEVTNRPIWTYMEDMACSGGYYISMPSDTIYANRNSWTGSIGVIVQLTNMKELSEKIGIKNIAITSAKNKDIGSAWKDMTDEQTAIFQSMVDEAYDQFLDIISENRGISIDQLKPIADGRIYTAKQALDLNLIDEIATYEDLVTSLEKDYNAKVFTPKTPLSKFPSLFFGSITKLKPKSDAEIIADVVNNERNGVVMYYVQPGY